MGSRRKARLVVTEAQDRVFAMEYVRTGGNAKAAAKAAYYPGRLDVAPRTIAARGAAAARRPEIRELIKQALADANVTPGRIAQVISEAMNATLPSNSPDHVTRLRSTDIACRLLDAYSPPPQQTPSQHLHLHLEEPDVVKRFIVVNGRYPTREERERLLQENGTDTGGVTGD